MTTDHFTLVRDRIPELIEAGGDTALTCIVPKSKFLAHLKDKLIEEVDEAATSRNRRRLLEELADIQEVIDTILQVTGYSKEELERAQRLKRESRGGFTKRLFLISTQKKARP